MDMLTIIRTKLGLGGDVTLGELNTGKINELEDKLNALTARSSGGTKKSSPSSKVQPTNAK